MVSSNFIRHTLRLPRESILLRALAIQSGISSEAETGFVFVFVYFASGRWPVPMLDLLSFQMAKRQNKHIILRTVWHYEFIASPMLCQVKKINGIIFIFHVCFKWINPPNGREIEWVSMSVADQHSELETIWDKNLWLQPLSLPILSAATRTNQKIKFAFKCVNKEAVNPWLNRENSHLNSHIRMRAKNEN